MSNSVRFPFCLFAAIFTFSTFVEPYPFSWMLKLAPMGILLYFVYSQMTQKHERLFFVGLICSTFGDFFLDFGRDNLFLFGLGSFLLAHLFYMACLWPVAGKRYTLVIGYIVYGVSMLWLIGPGLGSLMIPVVIYIGVLLLMGISTLVSQKSNGWLVIGGLSFVISDSLIGLNRFYQPIPYSHFLIMMTYYFAQYSLVMGIFFPSRSENV